MTTINECIAQAAAAASLVRMLYRGGDRAPGRAGAPAADLAVPSAMPEPAPAPDRAGLWSEVVAAVRLGRAVRRRCAARPAAAAGVAGGGRIPRLVRGLAARVAAWREHRATIGALSRMSDRDLADIGLDRSEIRRVFDPGFAQAREPRHGEARVAHPASRLKRPVRAADEPDRPHRRGIRAGAGGDDIRPGQPARTRSPPGPGPADRPAVGGAALLALLAAAALAGPAAAQGGPPAAPAVTVAAPLSRVVPRWEEFTARIEPSARVEVRPRVSGQVVQVHFRDGALVRAGDLLFTLDQRPFQIAVEGARAEVARAEARLVLADQQVRRYAPLVQQRFAPESEMDTRRSALQEAQAGLAAARAALRRAELDLEFSEVRAPRAGRVGDRRVDAGNLVQQGQTLLTTLLALDPVYAVFDASEAEHLRLARAGGAGAAAAAAVQLRLLDEAAFGHEGRLDFVDSAFDPRSGTVRNRAVVPNPDLFLTPGGFARLRLSAGDAAALMVPDAAVVADQSGRAVLTVAPDGTVAPRPVQLGPLVDGLRVVRSGLDPEDRVVIGGFHRARPGARVTAEQGRIGPGPLASAAAR